MIRCFTFILAPILVLCCCCWNHNVVYAQPFRNVAVLVNSPVVRTNVPSTIKVFRSASQTVEFDKATFSGGPLPQQHLIFKGNDPRHPGSTQEETSTVTLTLPANLPLASRIGIFTITATEDEISSELLVLLLNESTPLKPVAYSTVVQQSQSTQLMVTTTDASSQIRWRRNGAFCNGANEHCQCSEGSTCEVGNIQEPLVYECFNSGKYSQYNHAIMSIVVRDCDNTHWGEDCSEMCMRCFNGGTCHDKTGLCQSPPGFTGDHCENVHSSNIFGQGGEYRCSESEEQDCQGSLICYPNPFGCICPAGYSGLDCLEECTAGKFGANCEQECHCADGVDCDPATGVCGEGGADECAREWKGVNCQVEVPCQQGIFGELCTLPCSCSPGDDCQEVKDNCAAGCAIPWTGAACDNNTGSGRIEEITYVKVNPGITTNVTCTAIRNPILESNKLILRMGSPLVAVDGQLTVNTNDRAYSLAKQWVILSPTEPLTVECSISGTDIKETMEIHR